MTNKKNRISITILSSIISPFIVFLAIPMSIFGNNITEFLFDWSDFIPLCLGLAIIVSAVIFFSIFFLPEKAYKICLHILISVNFLVFLQSTYLNGNITLIGDNISSKTSTFSNIINLIIWVVTITGGGIVLGLLKDKKKYIRTGALILSIVIITTQMISTAVPVISNKNYFKSQEERTGQAAETVNYSTCKDLNVYSTTGNIYYFLIDMFDEKYAELAQQTESNIYNNLTGFTWYKDNITLYGHTYPSIAYALTGTEHSSDLLFAEYMEKAYEENNYLTELKNAGYTINLYTDIGNVYSYTGLPEYVNNALPCKKSLQSKFSLFFKMIKLGMYVASPSIIKPYLGNVTSSEFESLYDFSAQDGTKGFHTKYDPMDFVKDIDFKSTEKKQFTFFHMAGTHNVESDDQTKSTSATGLTKKSLEVIDIFLQNLKDNGLYDDATIVITGDHPWVWGHPAPVGLFFKPAQSHEEASAELKISQNKVEQKNIMPSIFDSIGVVSEIATAKGDTPLHLTDSNSRKFVYHTFSKGFTETVYNISGNLLVGEKSTINYNIISQKFYKDRYVYS